MGFQLERGKCARHAEGFTLIETMIALGVSAVAMVAIMNVLSRQTLMQSSIQSRADMQDFVSEKRLALDVARDRLAAADSPASVWDLIKAVNFVATTSGSVEPTKSVTWNMKAQHLDEEKRRKREPLTPTSRNDILVVEPTNLAQPFWIPNAHNLPELDTVPASPSLNQLLQLPGTFVGSKVDRARWINLTPPDLEPDAPDQLRRIRFTKWSVQLFPIGDTTITGFTPKLGKAGLLYQAKLHFEADKALTRGPANSDGGARGLRVPGAQSMSADIDLGGQCEVAPQTGDVSCLATGSGRNGGSSNSGTAPTPEARAIVVVHSQSDQEPECPAGTAQEEGWDDLLGRSGFSYMGSQIDKHSVASQDLGGMGSCVMTPFFQNTPTLECGRGDCNFKSGNDVGFWLFNSQENSEDKWNVSKKVPTSLSMISRCRVCARKNTSIVTVHSYSKEAAKCPKDHSVVLWEGYSLKSTTTNNLAALEISQDLSGTGSCLRRFRKIPFTECKEQNCWHNTPDDQAQWLYAPIGTSPQDNSFNLGSDAAKVTDRVSRCAVCATSLPK